MHTPTALQMSEVLTNRSLAEIAGEIERDWGSNKVNYAVKPYLMAMYSLNYITDSYFADSAASVVRYFLSNAMSWRGEKAKAIKAELKDMLKEAGL